MEINTPESELGEVIGWLDVADDALVNAFERLDKLLNSGDLYGSIEKNAALQEKNIIKIGTSVTNTISSLNAILKKLAT